MNFKQDHVISPFNLKFRPCFHEKVKKAVPFERNLIKVKVSHQKAYLSTSRVTLSAISGETHSVSKLFTAISSSINHS